MTKSMATGFVFVLAACGSDGFAGLAADAGDAAGGTSAAGGVGGTGGTGATGGGVGGSSGGAGGSGAGGSAGASGAAGASGGAGGAPSDGGAATGGTGATGGACNTCNPAFCPLPENYRSEWGPGTQFNGIACCHQGTCRCGLEFAPTAPPGYVASECGPAPACQYSCVPMQPLPSACQAACAARNKQALCAGDCCLCF